MSNGLSTQDREDFTRLDKIICDGAKTFVIVGNALAEINSRELWSDQFEDFSHYLSQYGMSRSYAYGLIKSAKIAEHVSAIADTAPVNEGQARELTKAGDKAAEAWERAQEKAGDGKPITAKVVKEAVKEVVAPKPDPDPEPDPEVSPEPDPIIAAIEEHDATLKIVASLVRQARQSLNTTDVWCGVEHTHGKSLRSTFTSLVSEINSCMSGGVCPLCEGEGCKHCSGAGWIIKAVAAQIDGVRRIREGQNA